MKKETKTWLSSFFAGFLATVLGIALTFGIDGLISAGKREKTARLLSEQILDKMVQTQEQLHEYLDMYDFIDSTSVILQQAIQADTLDRLDNDLLDTFLVNCMGEYVQVEIDDAMEVYKSEILNTIGNVDLLVQMDEFFNIARQCAKISGQVIDQKRVVSDLAYTHFYNAGGDITRQDYVMFLSTLPEFHVFFFRLQQVRYGLRQGDEFMLQKIDACKELLHLE